MSFVDDSIKKLSNGLSALARRVRALETKEHASGGGGGTVTSVGLTMPVEFTVGGSPIVGAGVLGVVKATEDANKVWAGPVGGGPAVPTFRVLDPADIPALPASGITQLTSDVLAGPGTGSQVATLKNTGPGATGPIGDTSHTPVITIDAQGRVTALTSVAITGTTAAIPDALKVYMYSNFF